MCKSCSVMISCRGKEHLCFMLKSSKWLRMNNSVPISLKGSPYITFGLINPPASAFAGKCSNRRQNFSFVFLGNLTNTLVQFFLPLSSKYYCFFLSNTLYLKICIIPLFFYLDWIKIKMYHSHRGALWKIF